MPLPLCPGAQPVGAVLSDLSGEHSSKPVQAASSAVLRQGTLDSLLITATGIMPNQRHNDLAAIIKTQPHQGSIHPKALGGNRTKHTLQANGCDAFSRFELPGIGIANQKRFQPRIGCKLVDAPAYENLDTALRQAVKNHKAVRRIRAPEKHGAIRCCQTKANWSQIGRFSLILRGKLPPFGQRDLTVLLEPVSVVDMAL